MQQARNLRKGFFFKRKTLEKELGNKLGNNMKKEPRTGRKPDEGSLSDVAMRYLFWSLEIRGVEKS